MLDNDVTTGPTESVVFRTLISLLLAFSDPRSFTVVPLSCTNTKFRIWKDLRSLHLFPIGTWYNP